MNRKLKISLKEALQPPAPAKKAEFLRRVPVSAMGYWDFLWSQIAYIRKWNWGFSILIFIMALIGARWTQRDMLWNISALMPFLALLLITESGRSDIYNMTEFEMSTRFSLKSIILARLGILGTLDFLLVCLIISVAFGNSEMTILQTGVYMICPYLLTTFLGLWAVQKFYGKEAVYLCAGIAVLISFGNVMLHEILPISHEKYSLFWWFAALIFFCAGTFRQGSKMINQKEEPVWNL